MQQVKAAALAPAEPSPQDYKVASDAAQKEQNARGELAKEQSADISSSSDSPPSIKSQSDQSVAGEQVLKVGSSGLSEQVQKTAAVVSGFYAGISVQSQSSINFSV